MNLEIRSNVSFLHRLLLHFSQPVEEQQDFSENYWVGKLVRHELVKFYCNLILKLISL